ncbi:hypothetical protein TNCV_1006811 [Trichonephila clavipes]|nr:hypothetical protein TNCV_1006811 [Trichonephila clavipes]
MASVDFLHHENPPIWAGVEPAILAHELRSLAAVHIAVPTTDGEDSQRDSQLVLDENRRGLSDFRLILYKQSDDSHLSDEQQLLCLTQMYQPQRSRCLLPSLDCLQLFVDQQHVW